MLCIAWSTKFTKHIFLRINPSCQRKMFHTAFDSLREARLLELLAPISSLKWGWKYVPSGHRQTENIWICIWIWKAVHTDPRDTHRAFTWTQHQQAHPATLSDWTRTEFSSGNKYIYEICLSLQQLGSDTQCLCLDPSNPSCWHLNLQVPKVTVLLHLWVQIISLTRGCPGVLWSHSQHAVLSPLDTHPSTASP